MIYSPGYWTSIVVAILSSSFRKSRDHQIRLNWSICVGHFASQPVNILLFEQKLPNFRTSLQMVQWLQLIPRLPSQHVTDAPRLWDRLSLATDSEFFTWSDTCSRPKVEESQVDINVTQCHTSTVGHMANKHHGPGHCSLSKHNPKIFKIAGSFMLIVVISIWVCHMLLYSHWVLPTRLLLWCWCHCHLRRRGQLHPVPIVGEFLYEKLDEHCLAFIEN